LDGERPSTFDQTNSDVFLKTVLSSGLTREQEIKKEKKKKYWLKRVAVCSASFVPFFSARPPGSQHKLLN